MSSSATHLPLQHNTHHKTFSPSRSERTTRTLESMGDFASPTPFTNGHASGSDGLHHGGSHGMNIDTKHDVLNSVYNDNGEGSSKPAKKRKKKGWKGWALVIEDDHGNVLEINDGPAPDPLPSSRRATGRRVSDRAPTPPVPDIPVVKKSKSPSPYIEDQKPRGSAPPSFPTAAFSKKSGGYWKSRAAPLLDQTAGPSQPEHQQVRAARHSRAASTLSPEPVEQTIQIPKTADAPRPRHSLPKAKSVIKKARASTLTGQTRSQPSRGDTQPSTARATPTHTPDERPAKTPRHNEDLPTRTSRTARPMDQSPALNSEIREEASQIIARANERRELMSDSHVPPFLSSPNDDEITPASSTRLYRSMSPSRTGGTGPRIRMPADNDAESDDDFDAKFDAELEQVKAAYRRGIQPWNNPYAPQQRSVPIYGLEDADPPDWPEDRSPTIVLAPRRDRSLPNDAVGRAHRQGFDGLTDEDATNAHLFVEMVKDNLLRMVTQHLPQPTDRREALVEQIGRNLTTLGHALTDSGIGALSDRPLPPLPPPGSTFD